MTHTQLGTITGSFILESYLDQKSCRHIYIFQIQLRGTIICLHELSVTDCICEVNYALLERELLNKLM